MCGITGLFSPRKEIDVSKYYQSHSLLKHRGPDDEGFIGIEGNQIRAYRGDDSISHYKSLPHITSLMESRMVLGHRRLSIIDLTWHGHQPYFDEGTGYYLVFNGEIFNYIELRNELKKLGHSFAGESDTEVVYRALLEWGPDAFNRFNGMWAIAFYDHRKGSMMLSRDRFGIKPLFYCIKNGVLYFASEMKFILDCTKEAFSPNLKSIRAYLDKSHLNYSENTFWNEIQELEPSHWLEWNGQSLHIDNYWKYQPKERKYSDIEALEKFTYLFEDSLKLRMRSDVEVGTLLSGGLDSSTIVCGLQKLGFIKNNNFKSFSAVFREEAFNEKKYIDETIKRVPMKPYFTNPGPREFLSDFDDLMRHMEEPFRSLSVYSQYVLYRMIKDKTQVKVVLNGQGADELFGGYNVHYFRLFAALFNKIRWFTMIKEMDLYRKNRKVSLRDLLFNSGKELIKSGFSPRYFLKAAFQELCVSSLREYLKYDDRNSMAFGIEARVPFLDYRMVEFAFSLSDAFKIRGFTNKYIERQYASGLVPDSVLNRKDKMGFVSPQELWQKKELEPLFSSVFSKIKDKKWLSNLLGRKAFEEYKLYSQGKNDDWAYIWRMFCLYKWKVIWKI